MGKKKTAKASTTTTTVQTLFEELQTLNSQWYEKEREGIALIEGFQTALVGCREEMGSTSFVSISVQQQKQQRLLSTFAGMGANSHTDPLLVEDLYAQVKQLRPNFEALLAEMYHIQDAAHAHVVVSCVSSSEPVFTVGGLVLTPMDYLQFIKQEVATFEAEFQHVEALLEMISFEISTDQLRTLVISWSTSPFLNPSQSKEFRQRHELALRLKAAS